jgi:hypothetical protein
MAARSPNHSNTTATSPDLARWRERRLRKAGFGPARASELAREPGIDFHSLLGLIDRGCPPHLAERIVAPLDEDTSLS